MTFKQFLLTEEQLRKPLIPSPKTILTQKDKEKKRQQKHSGAKKNAWRNYAD
jgi:hypothetical protein